MLCYELWQVGSFPDVADVLVSFLWDLPYFLIFFSHLDIFLSFFFVFFFRLFSCWVFVVFLSLLFFGGYFPQKTTFSISYHSGKKKSNQGKVEKSKPKECGLACLIMQSEKIILLLFFFFSSSSFIFIIVHPLWPLLCLFFLSLSPTCRNFPYSHGATHDSVRYRSLSNQHSTCESQMPAGKSPKVWRFLR